MSSVITNRSMSENYDLIVQLILRYLRAELTDDDDIALKNWLNIDPLNKVWFDQFANGENIKSRLLEIVKVDSDIGLKKAHKLIRNNRIKARAKWLSVAAIIIGFIVGGVIHNKNISVPSKKDVVSQDTLSDSSQHVLPGINQAILAIHGGFEIKLDSTHTGLVNNQANVNVVNEHNVLKYTRVLPNNSANSIFNTLRTPKGGQYELILSDGSKVWLNAESSIRYPIVFSGITRRVEITGEVFFEISANKKNPFIVGVKGNEIEALGTRFNVNAYDNSLNIRTTLVEGNLHLRSDGHEVALVGGQAAEFIAGNNIMIDTKPNIEMAIAWKQGYFVFNNWNSMLMQLERWYNIDVRILDTPKYKFSWIMPRNTEFDSVEKRLRTLVIVTKQGRVYTVSKK